MVSSCEQIPFAQLCVDGRADDIEMPFMAAKIFTQAVTNTCSTIQVGKKTPPEDITKLFLSVCRNQSDGVQLLGALLWEVAVASGVDEFAISSTALSNSCPSFDVALAAERIAMTAIFNITFIMLLRTQPSEKIITACADVVEGATQYWFQKPRSGSIPLTRMMCFTSSALAVLHLRAGWLGGFGKKKEAARMSRALCPAWASAMARKGSAQSDDDAIPVFSFLVLQLTACYGLQANGEDNWKQVIYHLQTANDYIGRSQMSHPGRRNIGGMAVRWEQHLRQMEHHFRCSQSQKRTRYQVLLQGVRRKHLFVFARAFVDKEVMQARESLHILLCSPRANNLFFEDARNSNTESTSQRKKWED